MKICIVLSTRPEIIKLAPLIKLLKLKKENFFLINTNQHYLNMMSNIFFKYFNIPHPKYNIKASAKTHGIFFSKTIKEIEKILFKEKPNFLIVQGDTNTALAGCLAASLYNRKFSTKYKKIKVVHVESGLRSFDDKMPEEVNRKLIDHLSNILFPPTDIDLKNLKNENIKDKKIYKVGNTISDTIKIYLPKIKKNKILNKIDLRKKNYFLLTLHRPESVDNIKNLTKLLFIFQKISNKLNRKFIFPVHPRTQKILNKIKNKKFSNIKFLSPLNYLDFMKLLLDANIVYTDSGGIQEEASIIGVPCITLRTTTERQITVKKKVNILCGYEYKKIFDASKKFNEKKINKNKFFGNGNVSELIYKKLKVNC